jgi:hypothetical protein
LVVAVAMLVFCGSPATAQSPSPLDEELLEEIDSDPLDPVDRVAPQPGDRRPGGVDDGADEEFRQRLRRELGAAADSEDDEPLLQIARLMREAEGRLAGRDVGPVTQDVQRQIVDDLDKLIEEARKKAGQCRSGSSASQPIAGRNPQSQPTAPAGQPSGPQSNNPAADSSPRPRENEDPPERIDTEQVRAIIKELWGELPEQQREQMIESPPEEFLPKYELLIEEYFRRLSEEKGR